MDTRAGMPPSARVAVVQDAAHLAGRRRGQPEDDLRIDATLGEGGDEGPLILESLLRARQDTERRTACCMAAIREGCGNKRFKSRLQQRRPRGRVVPAPDKKDDAAENVTGFQMRGLTISSSAAKRKERSD